MAHAACFNSPGGWSPFGSKPRETLQQPGITHYFFFGCNLKSWQMSINSFGSWLFLLPTAVVPFEGCRCRAPEQRGLSLSRDPQGPPRPQSNWIVPQQPRREAVAEIDIYRNYLPNNATGSGGGDGHRAHAVMMYGVHYDELVWADIMTSNMWINVLWGPLNEIYRMFVIFH